jgi:hypothetical protein
VYTEGHALLRGGAGTVAAGRPLTAMEQKKFLVRNVAEAIIQPEEADELIDYMVDESVMFGEATVERMTTNEKDIRFLQLTEGILRLATCNATPEESVSISNTNKCLRTISLDAKFYLCDNDLQDGLTGPQLEQQLMRMTGEQIANETELVAWMGNENGSYLAPSKVNNGVMTARDMWYRQLQQGHVLNAGGFGLDPVNGVNTGRSVSFHKLNCMQRAMPTKFRRNRPALRYIGHDDVWHDFAELHQRRETDLGDRALLGPAPKEYFDVPWLTVPLIPTDIRNCGCESLSSANGTFMVLSDPANFVVGIQKNITFERWRDGPRHLTWLIWTFRFDALIFNPDQSVLLDCMNLTTCSTSTCSPAPLTRDCFGCIDQGTYS